MLRNILASKEWFHMLRHPLGQAVLLVSGLVASAMVIVPIAAAAPAEQPASGSLTVEWFGWSHYRFTSPTGKVILTNPFTANPDSPIKAEDVDKADLIVVADGHGDEVGSTVQIANQTGATVLAPGGVNSWLIEQGVPRAQVPKTFFQPGDRYTGLQGITVRSVESVHGSELAPPTAAVPYGGVAAGYFITFENGFTVYFSGSSAAMAEQGLWASMYKPNLVILHMGADHEPIDFAQQVKLLKTDNPNLTTVFPHHNRVSPPAGQTTVAQVQSAIDAMGVDQKVTQPPLAQEVTFP
ncbi:MAG TPA: MBL fold metallo-hydrolase [Chloroflexota bacterium]|jgi:L-ascorbate metabolism protein UlaG (beta-lactamase superfamily)